MLHGVFVLCIRASIFVQETPAARVFSPELKNNEEALQLVQVRAARWLRTNREFSWRLSAHELDAGNFSDDYYEEDVKEFARWRVVAGGPHGLGAIPEPLQEPILVKKAFNATPALLETETTDAGTFSVYKFPLEYSEHTLYWRRFGVDMPRECMDRPCPVLFDFHGSYDSLISQRNWTKWYQYQAQVVAAKKFVLVTPEGSPDAITRSDLVLTATSWNVEGWGTLTRALEADSDCSDATSPMPTCLETALRKDIAYNCYGTQQYDDPDLCRPYAKAEKPMYASKQCASATAANDWDYMAIVTRFVVDELGADKTRIYFSGQSMGGMSSLQFAVSEGKYALPPDLRPAAIAPCSPGGSRNNEVELHGKVPTLLMQGAFDTTAPGSIWGGSSRKLGRGGWLKPMSESPEFLNVLKNETIIAQAMAKTFRTHRPEELFRMKEIVLQADAMTGGMLLADLTASMDIKGRGCKDSKGAPMGLDTTGYMWETLSTTLARVTGEEIDMRDLEYSVPSNVPKDAADDISLLCADVTARSAPADIRVCVFGQGHTFPWLGPATTVNSTESTKKDDTGFLQSAQGGKVFHDLIYEDFFKGGEVKRVPDTPR